MSYESLSENALVSIGLMITRLDADGRSIDRFTAEFDDGMHQLVAVLKRCEMFPPTNLVVCEGWSDFTKIAEKLNDLMGYV